MTTALPALTKHRSMSQLPLAFVLCMINHDNRHTAHCEQVVTFDTAGANIP